jgi:hypothetical protein
VLNCEGGSLINESSQTCYSRSDDRSYNLNLVLGEKCPNLSNEYEYGCKCENGLYYNFYSNTCASSCPP